MTIEHLVPTFAFLLGTFAAATVMGVSGFAFGLVAAAIWLQILPPTQVTALIVLDALLVQGHAVWRTRSHIEFSRLWPFVLGSAVGLPIGIYLLHFLPPRAIRVSVAVLLIAFSAYALSRPAQPRLLWAGRTADAVVGTFNGIVCGATGLAGIIVVVWVGMRGWTADQQRAVFQPTAVATFLLCLPLFGGSGMFSSDTIQLFLLGLPLLFLGNAFGWWLYLQLNESSFRKAVLWLLLLSGISLIAAGR